MLLDAFIPTTQRNGSGGIERSEYAGGIANAIRDRNDVALRRPFFDHMDRPAVVVNAPNRWTTEKGVRVQVREQLTLNDLYAKYGMQSPVANATMLRKEEWLELDRQVLDAARYPLRLYADIGAANSYSLNGMAKEILEHETISDPGEAIVDMDAMTEGRSDAPKFQLEGLPLPIIHVDFWLSERKRQISGNTGIGIDSRMIGFSGARIGEKIEKITIGNNTGVIYGGASTHVGGYGRTSQVYGALNFTNRLTKTNFTAPTAVGWVPSTTLGEFLAAIDQLKAQKFFGPFMVYTSNDWDRYLDNDYYVALTSGAVAPTKTLRTRLKEISQIVDVRRLDMLFASKPQTNPYWTTSTIGTTGQAVYTGPGGEEVATAANPFTLIFMQLGGAVPAARAVHGLGVTTTQWESHGGYRLNFKTLCIEVAQFFADFYGNCGTLIGTTS